jgi:hypothetical protein
MSSAPVSIALHGPDWAAALRSMQPAKPATASSSLVCAASEIGTPDFLAFYGDVAGAVETAVPRERRIIVISEPPGILRYQPGFLNQFGIAVSPFALPGFRGHVMVSQPGIPWFYGCTFGKGRTPAWRYTFEQLEAMPMPAKINAVSAVLSRKNQAPLHVARVKCAEALARRFPGNVRIFGSGFDPIDDKADVIDPYRFHLALENTRDPVYWSEKIADAFLGWAMPVYEGCTRIEDSFPESSLARIDVTEPEAAIRILGDLLERGERATSQDALTEARRRLLHEHALPCVLKRAVAPLIAGGLTLRTQARETLQPNAKFSFKGRMRGLVRALRSPT